ncbi:hypothetical protein GHT06_021917 [Daphnia sinensis]|uniref:Uncharacterized protein n=1 Tax=Daphnia sinensis TaxID=1820382 RepID=A0AAD5KGK7_9CRUS|nr:hypothetical protein GHT06_021917 [Daphnia sinensis]
MFFSCKESVNIFRRVFGISFFLNQDVTSMWWHETQTASQPEGIVCLKLAPELIATGQYSRLLENAIAAGKRRRQRVHFFLAETQPDFK